MRETHCGLSVLLEQERRYAIVSRETQRVIFDETKSYDVEMFHVKHGAKK